MLGRRTYPLVDGLGSTVNLVDAAGNVAGSYTYDAFGAVRSHSGSSTEFSFTGEQNDPNGLEYLRARYYDPAIGRFLGQDPAAPDYNAPGTLNRFAYVLNNPANFVDPTGQLLGIEVKCGICGSVISDAMDVVVDTAQDVVGPVANQVLKWSEFLFYGLYYGAYQTLAIQDELGPGLMIIAPFGWALVIMEAIGLAGDCLSDRLQGESCVDAGYVGCVLPDPFPCGTMTYLNGVRWDCSTPEQCAYCEENRDCNVIIDFRFGVP